MMTPDEQDRVVEGCHQCGMCVVGCPAELDVAATMRRARAMRYANGLVPVRHVLADRLLPFRPGPSAAALAARLTASVGVGAPKRRQRFSRWFAQRTPRTPVDACSVALFPTCLVEYQAPEIGQAIVGVYERASIALDVVDVGCCGAPWLAGGNDRAFAAAADRVTTVLATVIRSGREVVVAEPTCGYTLGVVAPQRLQTSEAELVAAHSHDAAEYLAARIDRLPVADGAIPHTIVQHVPCHLRARGLGDGVTALLRSTGAAVEVVEGCAEIGPGAAPRGETHGARLSAAMASAIEGDSTRCVGSCHLASVAIGDRLGGPVVDPFRLLADAHGIAAPERPRER
jgi:Fe-S oxidoreductase